MNGWKIFLLLSAMLSLMSGNSAAHDGHSYWAYVGTYTRGPSSEGIYVFSFDSKSGAVGEVALAAESDNPSFLAVHPDGQHLYAANEVGDFGGESSGAITSYRITQDTGRLEAINQQSSRGAAPCHLVVDPAGRNVLVANYTGGSVAAFPVQHHGGLDPASSFHQHSGSSVNPRRQTAPHAHSINLDPAGKFAFAADLGLDKILIYRLDVSSGTLEPHEPASVSVDPGAGPRHFAFHPSGKFAYVINELSRTVTAFRHDQQGKLESIQTISTVPEGISRDGFSTAEVRVHPSGKFLYGSNRGHNSIVIYQIDPQQGTLTLVGNESTRGETPRNFAIDPSGEFLFAENQKSGDIVQFKVDTETGKLTPTGRVLKVPSPVCIRFVSRS